jgi:tetratricopeptide (TPR) repeat protein
MQVAERRSTIFCSVPNTLLENEIIRKDVEKALDGVERTWKSKEVGTPKQIPVRIKAELLKHKGKLDRSLQYYKLAVAEDPQDPICAYKYAEVLLSAGKKETMKEFVGSNAALGEDEKTYFMLFTNQDEGVVEKATHVLQKDGGNPIARINRAIAYKRMKNIPEMNKDLKELEQRTLQEAFVAGIAALRKDKNTLLKNLAIALAKRQISLEDVKTFPVFEDYRNDEDFEKIVQEQENRLKFKEPK